MGKTSKGTQSSFESTQQSVQMSQTVGDLKQILPFPKLPFGLAISPKEFRMLKATCHSIVTQHDGAITCKELRAWYTVICLKYKKNKLIQDESLTTQQKILY